MSTKLWNRLDKEAADLWLRPRAEVRQQLAAHFMRFAEQLATKFCGKNRKVDPDDAQGEAYVALVAAVDDFDPQNERGASFTTFAGWRIRGAIVESARKNDHVNHKVRAADKELRRQLETGEADHSRAVELVPHLTHFADEHTGKKRQENLIADPTEPEDERWQELEAEKARWPADVRETVELLVECGWDVGTFVERVYAADSTVSDDLLWKCDPPEKAVMYLRGVLEFIGADTAICPIGVKEMPPVEHTERQYGVAL